MIEQKRWYVVLGGIICQFCIGMLYSWSVFVKPIENLFGWDNEAVSLTFSISTFMLPIAMIVSGKLLPKYGPKKLAMAGGIVLCSGLIIASRAQSLPLLYFGYGFLGGAGVGIVYGIPIAVCVKWFPERTGMISGLAVAGFGLGSVVYAPVATALIRQIGPMHTFFVQGLVAVTGIFLGASLLKTAPDGYAPPGFRLETDKQGSGDYTAFQMLRTWQYWYLLVIYIFANITGLMMVGHASPIGQQVAHLSEAQAASVVSVLAILNMFGRFSGGVASDRFGSLRALSGIFALSAFAMFAMNYMTNFVLYAVAIGAVAFCFGATVGIFPSIVLAYYGQKHYGLNYGLMFLAYGIGGLVGPLLASMVLKYQQGNYTLAFIIAGILCIAGVVMPWLVKPPVHPEV